MSLPVIGPEQDFALWAILLAVTAFSFWCERFVWVRKYSSVTLVIVIAIALSNFRIIPSAAPAYDVVWDYLVPIAIPLLLFQADLKRIATEAGPTLIAFFVAATGVVAGAIIAASVMDLGPQEAELAGIFTGTYIGGGLNFFAVADATGMQGSSILAAAYAADNVVTNLHFLLVIVIPGVAWMVHKYPSRHIANARAETREGEESHQRVVSLDLTGWLLALALAFALAAIGKTAAALAGKPEYAMLTITALALIVATAFPGLAQSLSGYHETGTILIYVFLASASAAADVWELIELAPILVVYAAFIIFVHMAILFGVGLLFRFDLAELAVASAVCIGGPSSALALASAKGWRDLIIPGVLAGSFGYASGSFIGVMVTEWLR
ncbi:MAG: DUF819 family protein [Gammaproteobacteria bacterium]|nr:DUF819 family protein [Gammaproteobacteria bacterium]